MTRLRHLSLALILGSALCVVPGLTAKADAHQIDTPAIHAAATPTYTPSAPYDVGPAQALTIRATLAISDFYVPPTFDYGIVAAFTTDITKITGVTKETDGEYICSAREHLGTTIGLDIDTATITATQDPPALTASDQALK